MKKKQFNDYEVDELLFKLRGDKKLVEGIKDFAELAKVLEESDEVPINCVRNTVSKKI